MGPMFRFPDYDVTDDQLFDSSDFIPPELTTSELADRASLFAKYVSLEPSEELIRSATREAKAIRKAQIYIAEKGLDRKAAAQGTQLEFVANDAGYVHKVEEHRRKQRAVLARLYPSHQQIDSARRSLENTRSRIKLLRTALYDQTDALGKLGDAAGLLLLVADHIEVLCAICAQSCTASSGSFSSSDDDAGRSRCIPRSDETRLFSMPNVPGQYRIRYLRKCWTRAADALAAAVALSGFLASQLTKNGETELVPGIESKGRPSLSLFDLPGGLTVMFRSGALQRMENEAKNMREKVLAWHSRQRKFLSRVRKELSKARETVSEQDKELGELRRTLLTEEFSNTKKRVESQREKQTEEQNEETQSTKQKVEEEDEESNKMCLNDEDDEDNSSQADSELSVHSLTQLDPHDRLLLDQTTGAENAIVVS